MILDQDKFKQENSAYERPNFPFRCGRALKWGKPCAHGPNNDGSCGGVTECRPFNDNGRWLCRKTGGSCGDGPLPTGECSQRQLACQPARTIRGIRMRMAFTFMAVMVAIIAAFGFGGGGGGDEGGVFLSPGPISGIHQNFTADAGCESCHKPHNKSAGSVIAAAFTKSGPSESCTDCHGFAGSPTAAHNASFAVGSSATGSPHLLKTQCSMCHTEHMGVDGKITKMTDEQCHACHKVKFDSFTNGHPAFSANFPSRQRAKIAFNHTSHFEKHFVDPRNKANAPDERCVSCHKVSKAAQGVPVKSYNQMCSSCHDDAIKESSMVFFRLPEFTNDPFAGGKTTLSMAEAKKEFESASTEPLTPIIAHLLKVEADDPEGYSEAAGQLLRDMKETGAEAFVPLLEEAGGNPVSMLHGMPAELTKALTSAWAANKEYEPIDSEATGGWFATELTIGYKPSGHGDQVVKAWLDFAAKHGAESPLAELMDPSEGPGTCIKCHAVSKGAKQAKDDKALQIEWGAVDRSKSPFFAYNHEPHLNFLKVGAYCETCHKVDPGADISKAFKQFDPMIASSSFKPIKKETCAECHGRGAVAQNCLECHKYHNEPVINKSMGPVATK